MEHAKIAATRRLRLFLIIAIAAVEGVTTSGDITELLTALNTAMKPDSTIPIGWCSLESRRK